MNYLRTDLINTNWKYIIETILNNNDFRKQILINKLKQNINAGKTIYPPFDKTFTCFNYFNIEDTKVVILGQDPYHTPNKAMGLSFSIPSTETKIPPSLKNIFKELYSDIEGFDIPSSGDLTKWSTQGVLLLNCSLSVLEKIPNSHINLWDFLTNTIIKYISDNCENCIFLLWGNYARNKKTFIDNNKHYILEAAHPSPFSAHKGFFGCKHFSKANEYLASKNKGEIDWKLYI